MTAARSSATPASRFSARGTSRDIEEGLVLAPKFDQDGLIGCVVTDAATGEVLMFAHMNEDALARTIETGEAWFFSRSRSALWRKGESSGHTLRVVELRVDCDQDALWLKAERQGPGACHTGRRSCFYRAVRLDGAAGPATQLEFRDSERVFEPDDVYGHKA
jgi:phosphoribosyl-AMP cyclohydrolase